MRELVSFLIVGGSAALLYVCIASDLTGLLGVRPSMAILLTLMALMPPTCLAQRRLNAAP